MQHGRGCSTIVWSYYRFSYMYRIPLHAVCFNEQFSLMRTGNRIQHVYILSVHVEVKGQAVFATYVDNGML